MVPGVVHCVAGVAGVAGVADHSERCDCDDGCERAGLHYQAYRV